jgi:hypothetical protein
MAITSLLQRFKEVLQDAIDSEKLNKNIPMQRQKVAEISFVLKVGYSQKAFFIQLNLQLNLKVKKSKKGNCSVFNSSKEQTKQKKNLFEASEFSFIFWEH